MKKKLKIAILFMIAFCISATPVIAEEIVTEDNQTETVQSEEIIQQATEPIEECLLKESFEVNKVAVAEEAAELAKQSTPVIFETKEDAAAYLINAIKNRDAYCEFYCREEWPVWEDVASASIDKKIIYPEAQGTHGDFISNGMFYSKAYSKPLYKSQYNAYRYYYSFDYIMTADEEKYVNDRAKAVAKKYKKLSTKKKAIAITKWLRSNMKYKELTGKNQLNIYTSFKNKKGQCHHYALMYYKIAKYAGLNVRYVTGQAKTSNGWYFHAWNIVKVGKKWYHVDPCWADGVYKNGKSFYDKRYVLKGTKKFKNHKIDSKYTTPEMAAKYPIAK